jgi:hypothetical protein
LAHAELLEHRQMKQRVMGMRAHFAFEPLDVARQGFAVFFCGHGVAGSVISGRRRFIG